VPGSEASPPVRSVGLGLSATSRKLTVRPLERPGDAWPAVARVLLGAPIVGEVVGSGRGDAVDGDAEAVAAGPSAHGALGGDMAVERSKPSRACAVSRPIRAGRASSTTTNDPSISAATAAVNRRAVGSPWGSAPM